MSYIRSTNLYQPQDKKPFRISRSKIDLFLECPRCFYLDRRLGVGRPSIPAFTLNSAVDNLLKNEFDLLRKNGEKHELMERYRIDAVPYQHPDLPDWRDDHYQYVGICHHHQKTNLEICGIIDDIWQNNKEELIIVDYKSTSTTKEISLDDQYKQLYKKQIEVYQWIFKQEGFKVSNTSYFVYANAARNLPKFDGKLEFELQIIEYKGDDSWVEPTIGKIKDLLNHDEIPGPNDDCEYCQYRKAIYQQILTCESSKQSN